MNHAVVDPDVPHASWYHNFWAVSFFTLALALLLLLLYSHVSNQQTPEYKYLGVVLKEAGFACFVAFFLNLSVEGMTRSRHAKQQAAVVKSIDEKHQQRINEMLTLLDSKHRQASKDLTKNLFRTVYERNIDDQVFRVVENHLLKKNLMRRDYKISMSIRPISEEGDAPIADLVSLNFDIRYVLENISEVKVETVLLAALIDVSPDHEDKCQFTSATIGTNTFSKDELETSVTKDDVNACWTLKLSGPIEAGESLPISLSYKKVGPRNYCEVVCTTVQMDCLAADVLTMDPDLSVNAVSLHPENEVRVSPEERPEYTEWRINHAILPGQGIVIFWHPRRISTTLKG